MRGRALLTAGAVLALAGCGKAEAPAAPDSATPEKSVLADGPAAEISTVAADDLWLSGAYGRDTLAIHFTWRNEPDAVRALLPDLESALADFDARPHWGKLNGIPPQTIARVTPRLADARELFERLDPAGTFSNAQLERLGVRAPR